MAVEVTQTQTSRVQSTETNRVVSVSDSTNTLLHELQLGEQLNTCIHETRRADFSLMLAMLSEDVREQSQFVLPKTLPPTPPIQDNSSLRKQFHLPQQAPLALSTLDEIPEFNQAELIDKNDLVDIKLTDALTPKPLAFRDDKNHIDTQVITNMSLLGQLRYKETLAEKAFNAQLLKDEAVIENELATSVSQQMDNKLNKQLAFNASAWLDNVQESLVKAPLLN